jgi:thiol-disulfide isomerase/thioredoxin
MQPRHSPLLILASRLILAALLLTAAGLKAKEWLASGSPGLGGLPFSTLLQDSPAAPFFWPTVILGEGMLALALLSGKWPRAVLRMALVCFAVLGAVSLWNIFRGIAHCGCFGALHISPTAVYWIDCGACGLAVLALQAERGNRFKMGLVTSLLLLAAPADLSQGRWVVLLYSSSCGHCEGLAQRYAELAEEWKAQGRNLRVALIDAEPRLRIGFGVPPPRPSVVEGTLDNPELFHGEAVVLLLDQGSVTSVQEGREEIDWSRPPFSSHIALPHS